MGNEQSRSSTDTFVDCTVTFVNTKACTFDAVSKNGYRFLRDCQYADVSLDGSGNVSAPSAGDTCVVRINASEDYLLECLYRQYQRPDGNPDAGFTASTDAGASHPVFSKMLAGDKAWYTRGGAFLQLLRGGFLKIGVSSLCQMVFSKIENYFRLVTRNIEVLASGLHMYSVNSNGVNSTRISLFLSDSFSPSLQDRYSECSDFEISVIDNCLTIMTGPRGPDNLRKNACILTLMNNGCLGLYQNDPDTGNIASRVLYTVGGGFEHNIYGKDGAGDPLYSKIITRSDAGDISVREILVKGSYSLDVDNLHFTAKDAFTMNGKNIYSSADQYIASESIVNQVTASVHT